MRIVHLSKTPLASSPGHMSQYLNEVGATSSHFFEKDYPGDLANKMVNNSIHFNGDAVSTEILKEHLDEADIIHVHNYISPKLTLLINQYHFGTDIIYHVHSPLQEGPLFTNAAKMMDLRFTKLFVVAQYQPRHYQDYQPICNIVSDCKTSVLKNESKVPRVLYTPAHSRKGGRWNPKGSEILNTAIKSLSDQGKIELKTPKKMSSNQLLTYRGICDITIDEILTGSFHQISLEGLSAGNIVVNNADFFSLEMLKLAINSNEAPPFFKMSENNCHEKLNEIITTPNDFKEDLKETSKAYFKKYLSPQRLALTLLEKYGA